MCLTSRRRPCSTSSSGRAQSWGAWGRPCAGPRPWDLLVLAEPPHPSFRGCGEDRGGPSTMLAPAAEGGGEGQAVCPGPREASAAQHRGSRRAAPSSQGPVLPSGGVGRPPRAPPFGLLPRASCRVGRPNPVGGAASRRRAPRAPPIWLLFVLMIVFCVAPALSLLPPVTTDVMRPARSLWAVWNRRSCALWNLGK